MRQAANGHARQRRFVLADNMKQKIAFIIGVFLLAAIILGVIIGKNQFNAGRSVAPTPLPTFAPPAPTGSVFVQPQSVIFSFNQQPDTPAVLPAYTFTSPTVEALSQIAAKAAPALSLGSEAKSLLRGSVFTRTWSRPNEADLVVTRSDNDLSIVYHQAKSAGQSGLDPQAAAKQLGELLIALPQGVSLVAAGAGNGPFNGLLVIDPPAPPSYKEFFYSYTIGGYPILSRVLGAAPVSVVVDGRGVVRSATISPPPADVTQTASVNILATDQILQNLKARRGAILNTYESQAVNEAKEPIFSSFQIEETKIVYAPRDSQLLPAFLLTGTGADANSKQQKATFFLWAFPEPAQPHLP